MSVLHPDFRLIESGGAVEASGLQPGSGVIEIARFGAQGVIAGVLGAEATHTDVFLLRDPASPPPDTDNTGGIWLQTSGTTGLPKWAMHSLDRLEDLISAGKGERATWLLTFNPGSFAGLQVILSAMKGGHTLVAPPYGAGVGEMADLAVAAGVTHISGTPTFWRAFLMALGDRPLALKSATLGGEAADQAMLDAVRDRFPEAALRHIYATTELGRIFSVADGRAGFPAAWLGERLSVVDGTLRVTGKDTGDVVHLEGDRVLFRGRIDAMVNVGGVKVFPEAVEAHLLQLPFVQEARVAARPNPITGHILTADIVLKPFSGDAAAAIRAHLNDLPRSHRPASLRFVETIEVGATGKKLRV